jgi:hypothetical protein
MNQNNKDRLALAQAKEVGEDVYAAVAARITMSKRRRRRAAKADKLAEIAKARKGETEVTVEVEVSKEDVKTPAPVKKSAPDKRKGKKG